VITNIENWLKRFKAKSKDRRLTITVHPDIAQYLQNNKLLKGFMWDNWMLLEINEDDTLSPDNFQVYSKKRKREVTSEV